MLAAPREKFRRAEERLRELFEGIVPFHNREPYLLTREFETDPGQYVWKLQIREEFPIELAVTLGEALYDLHSGLEQVATAVGAEAFPIYKNRSKYWRRNDAGEWALNSGMRKVAGAPTAAQTLFEELQPYEEGHEKHPLWQLRVLSNWDKHQALHLLPIVAIGSGIRVLLNNGGTILSHPRENPVILEKGPLKDNAVVARLPTTNGRPLPDNVQVEVQFAFDQAFSTEGPDEVAGLLLQATVVEILDYVNVAVMAERFVPFAEG